MKTKKMQSLEKFELAKEEMTKTSGGRIWIIWTREITSQTADIGTYVDGMSQGTDGYGD
jgi:hypothetical protein